MPKRRIGKHLQFYIDCMRTGVIPGDGLCLNTSDCAGVLSEVLLETLTPTLDERKQLDKEGYSSAYWASGISRHDPDTYNAFTSLRQTIILFMAAINNEL
jgi:hypothetical protein